MTKPAFALLAPVLTLLAQSHAFNHVVVYVTDQPRGKAADVHLDGPMTHTEQNPLDHAVERIAIDLK